MTAASLPACLKWGFWISPLAYAEIGVSLNEFLAPRWQKVISQTTNIFYENWKVFHIKGYLYFSQLIFHDHCNLQVSSSNVTIGQQVLISRGLDFSAYFYWISVAALLGFWMVFNFAITWALSYLKRNLSLQCICLKTWENK